MTCNCCESGDATVLYEAGKAQRHRIVRCNQCDLMYADPILQLEYGTEENFDVTVNLEEIHDASVVQRIEKERLQVIDYYKTRNLINSIRPERGFLLEIGSGFGFLLSKFQNDGWDVRGIDPYAAACSYAKERNGVTADIGTLETLHVASDSVDVVIMNHVIEHVPDPVATLKEIYRITKPGGLFVMETPTYDTLMFKLLGRRERSLSCDGHIFFFTTKSLRNIYEKVGFRFIDLKYTGRSLTLNRLAHNVGIMSKSKNIKNFLNSISRKMKLNNVKIYLNMRDMQRVCVEK